MNPETVALIFPGQGSQHAGMGKALAEAFSRAREVFEEADDVLGRSISRLCFEGPEEELQKTENTQPALYVTSAAALAVLRDEGLEGGMAAGHSLGEYTALHAAGALDFATGLRLVAVRGRAMAEAGRTRPGTMAAVLGLDDAKVEGVCREASGEDRGVVVAANLNSPGQIVLSGDEAAVDRALELASAAGAKRGIKLKVGGAFHSPLMEGRSS
jgi:[acyl-carrier-protein] S-malonyltransferase